MTPTDPNERARELAEALEVLRVVTSRAMQGSATRNAYETIARALSHAAAPTYDRALIARMLRVPDDYTTLARVEQAHLLDIADNAAAQGAGVTVSHAPAVGGGEVKCVKCGVLTMHLGNVCYACSHPAPPPAPAAVSVLPCRDCGIPVDVWASDTTAQCTDCHAKQMDAPAAVAGGERTDLVTGVMRCAKCQFQLTRRNLYVQSGTVGPGNSKTEPCPNGCGPLWPVTWKDWATEGWECAEKLHMELQAALAAQPAADELGVMEGWHAAVDSACELVANARDDRFEVRAKAVLAWVKANRPAAQRPGAGDVPEGALIALVAGPYNYHHKMDEAAEREGKAFDRCRELTIQNIRTWCATQRAMASAISQPASGEAS